MTSIAGWLARRLWFGMLWFMRRPWMKRLQTGSVRLFPEASRPKVWASMVRQNRWARHHGEALLRWALNLLLYSVAFTFAYFLTLYILESGFLTRRG